MPEFGVESAVTGHRDASRPVVGRLVMITGLLLGLTVIHDVDHVRQGRALPVVLYIVAISALASLAFTMTVLTTNPTWARPVALAQGLATVVGVGAVHASPQWSPWTDSYAAAHADLPSWAIIIAMMATGLILALAALLARG